jgi:hypothetical protein
LVPFKRLINYFGSLFSVLSLIAIIERIMPLTALFLVITFLVCPTQENFWHTLAEVSFVKEKNADGYEVEKPVFSRNLKSHHGKKIQLKGYIIPLNEVTNANTFMFSSLPFNVCYFCGAAGPETVVELHTTQKIKFTTKQIMIQGVLNLNEKDPDHHIYILKSVTVIP